MIDMASKQIIPAVIKYTKKSGRDNQRSRNRLAQRLRVQVELLNETSALLSDTKVALAKLIDVTEEVSR